MAALPGVLATALDPAISGEPGTPQDERAASYAGFPPAEWYEITWDAGRRDVHNQIRFLRYLKSRAPAASFPIAQAPCQDNFLAASSKIPASHNHHRSRLRRVR